MTKKQPNPNFTPPASVNRKPDRINEIMPQIKVLIITNNPNEWIEKIIANIKDYTIRRRYLNSYEIDTVLFRFSIRTSFPDSMRGACYSCAILDKPIERNAEIRIRYCVKAPIIRTDNYYNK